MKLLYQLIIKFWFILIISVGLGQTTGCMDDGYLQWSPNFGSPACNYTPSAIIDDGSCQYYDCADECGGTAIEDECGICGGDGSICSDCNGVSNGTAYINVLCIDSDNNNGCVGGETGIPDCFNIDLSITTFMESNSQDTIKVFVTNLDTLKSLDIEFQYDSSILNITEFSLYGTALAAIGSDNYDYAIVYDTFVESGFFKKVKFTMYFEPHDNFELFSSDGREHIFNIVLEAMDIAADSTTQIIINELSVNEILMGETNWEGGEISVVVPKGCTEELACNYDPTATSDDGSCWSEAQGCACIDGEGSIADNCGTCDNDLSNDCVMDCNNVWGGHAYRDNCGACIIGSEDIDCFMSSFNLYNSNGNIIENDTIPELDILYVALHMQNLPNLLEGIIINLGFDTSILSLDDWSINPNDLDIEGNLTDELADFYIVEGEIIDTTFRAFIHGITNELYQENILNILFLQFSNLGINGDSTIISYNNVQVNENVMQDANYTSQKIYFGDCNGIFNGETPFDECGVCDGPGAIYDCLNGGYVGTGGCYDIADDACDCAGNTPEDLYVECVGVDCDCDGNLSINESLIPQSYTLSPNYPNPFNPITYIHYSVPNYDFINIDIINISGQIIKTIVQSSHQPGDYEIIWDGTNNYEIPVPSGIYFYKMDADEFVSVKKLVILK